MKTIQLKDESFVSIDSLLVGTTLNLQVNFEEKFDITYTDEKNFITFLSSHYNLPLTFWSYIKKRININKVIDAVVPTSKQGKGFH